MDGDGSMSKLSDTETQIADIELVFSKLLVDFKAAFNLLSHQRAAMEAEQPLNRSALQAILGLLSPDHPLAS